MTSKRSVRKVTRKKNDGSPLNRKENNSTRDESYDETSDHGEVSSVHREDNCAMSSSSTTKESASKNTRASKGFSAYGGGNIKPRALGQSEIKILHDDLRRAMKILCQLYAERVSKVAMFFLYHGLHEDNFVKEIPRLLSETGRLWFIREKKGKSDKPYKWELSDANENHVQMIHSFFSDHGWCKHNTWENAAEMQHDYLQYHIRLALRNQSNSLDEDPERRQAILDAENELQEFYHQEEHIEDVKSVPSSILINTLSPTRTHILDNALMKAP